jgi:hypothetical protein
MEFNFSMRTLSHIEPKEERCPVTGHASLMRSEEILFSTEMEEILLLDCNLCPGEI